MAAPACCQALQYGLWRGRAAADSE